ncbi:MAG TPA: hypothetical protein VJ044_15345, partial [Candidatus Hodarchaeales archaeon]|nr:hypothetical protein [Candidatus Hodarchaeales archaeon]
MKIIKIGLVLNTRRDHSEFQVEYDPPHTLELIKHGIEATGNHCLFLEADENVSEILKKTSPDLVFNRAEGLRGESRESHVPAILEMLNIPYVGSNILTTALALNKTWTKKILTFHGIKTADFTTLERIEDEERVNFGFPVILKPNEEGSSIGINSDNVVFNREQLRTKLSQMLL